MCHLITLILVASLFAAFLGINMYDSDYEFAKDKQPTWLKPSRWESVIFTAGAVLTAAMLWMPDTKKPEGLSVLLWLAILAGAVILSFFLGRKHASKTVKSRLIPFKDSTGKEIKQALYEKKRNLIGSACIPPVSGTVRYLLSREYLIAGIYAGLLAFLCYITWRYKILKKR
jgi:hypothetical protein